MLETEAIEIGSGNPVECSRRLLSAIQAGNAQSLQRELTRALRITRTTSRQSSLIEEQKELLGAIVERIQVQPYTQAEIFLLAHLAS